MYQSCLLWLLDFVIVLKAFFKKYLRVVFVFDVLWSFGIRKEFNPLNM